jgi:uncharacterized protein (TIGR03118 family)
MSHHQRLNWFVGLLLTFVLGLSACTDDQITGPSPYQAEYYDSNSNYNGVTYLVSDVPDLYPGARLDPMLRNGWGLASGNGMIWVAAEGSGFALAYDQIGNPMHPPVSIPTRTGDKGGAPTGAVYNNTPYFVIPGGGPAQFIFAGSDGSISAWMGGEQATLVATSSGEAEYTGLALVSNPRGEAYIYAADFENGKIDVYDKNFLPVSGMTFSYPGMDPEYAPFNVVAIGRLLYVAYAKRGPDGEEITGPGTGFVNIYTMRGAFIRRLGSGPEMNAPWGIAAVQSDQYVTKLYVANFGDGTISTYDDYGNFIGQLHDQQGNLIKVDGIWGIMIANPATTPGVDPNVLWFAAGPDDELHGTFGYIKIY